MPLKENFNYCPRFNNVYILHKLHFNTNRGVYFNRREWDCYAAVVHVN